MSSAQEFLDLCRQLRDMGAVEVTAGELSAKFVPPQVVLPAVRQLSPEEQRRKRVLDKATAQTNAKDAPFPAMEGDTEADIKRRDDYRALTERLTGNG